MLDTTIADIITWIGSITVSNLLALLLAMIVTWCAILLISMWQKHHIFKPRNLTRKP